MKVGIYTVMYGNNTIPYVPQWWKNAEMADVIHVLCVNNQDGTVKLLQQHGVHVTSVYHNNLSISDQLNFCLSLMPDDLDLCIRLDVDQELDPNWRTLLERDWQGYSDALEYHMSQIDRYNQPQIVKTIQIHKRNNTYWSGSLFPELQGIQNMVIKSDQIMFRSQTLQNYDIDQLRTSWPIDQSGKSLFLLARELTLAGDIEEAKTFCKIHLEKYRDNESQTGEICFLLSQLEPHDSLGWLRKGAALAPWRRENWYYLAEIYFRFNNYLDTLAVCLAATNLTKKQMHWLDKDHLYGAQMNIWGGKSAFHLKLYQHAVDLLSVAAEQQPDDHEIQFMLEHSRSQITS